MKNCRCSTLTTPFGNETGCAVKCWRIRWSTGATLLGDLPAAIELPTDYSRPPVQSFRGDIINFSLTPELTAKLKEISKQEDVTLFMTLLAAFRILLYRSTGQEAIAIGTPIANRQNSAIENLIGFFVNTLALRIDVTGDMTFRELLSSCARSDARRLCPSGRAV